MRAIRSALAALLVLLSLTSTPAIAASYSTDQSDLWYAVGEDGWNLSLQQRGATIFGTMYLYGPNGTPTWYVATMNPAGGPFIWSGDLYTATGSWFGAVPYNLALFTPRKVGTMTWTSLTVITGTLTYTVDGVAVAKSLTRFTLVNENYSGHFGGGIHENFTNCANPAFNGTKETIGVLNITENGTAVTIATLGQTGGSCTYNGTLNQYGQMGDVAGVFACSDGSAGSFDAFELQVTEFSMTGRFTASYASPAGCQGTGWFGGLTVTTF